MSLNLMSLLKVKWYFCGQFPFFNNLFAHAIIFLVSCCNSQTGVVSYVWLVFAIPNYRLFMIKSCYKNKTIIASLLQIQSMASNLSLWLAKTFKYSTLLRLFQSQGFSWLTLSFAVLNFVNSKRFFISKRNNSFLIKND